MTASLSIAIRYAAVRKQFGPTVGNELSILEYQSHQYRLLPSLAMTFVWSVSIKKIFFQKL
jgi:acyl-CoA oxidase